jgi:hypothetical protein
MGAPRLVGSGARLVGNAGPFVTARLDRDPMGPLSPREGQEVAVDRRQGMTARRAGPGRAGD